MNTTKPLSADRAANKISSDRIALAALLCGALAIAFAPIFVRLSELGPISTAFYRLMFSLPVLYGWMWFEDRRKAGADQQSVRVSAITRRDRFALILCGLFFAGDLAAWHWSIKLTSVANSTLLANFAPVFVTLGGFLFFGERFSRRFIGGMAIALIGAIVLMGDSLMFNPGHLAGDGLGVLTAIFYAGYILSVGRLRAKFSTATIMTWSGVITTLTLFPLAYFSGESFVASSWYGWGVLIGLALISHAGGQSLIAYALAHLPAAFGSVGLLFQPAAAAVLAWVLLSEPLGVLQFVGAAVIMAGVVQARRGSRG